jgi:hypothetical protein
MTSQHNRLEGQNRQNTASLNFESVMIGPFQYLMSQRLKFQGTIDFRGRGQRVINYQLPLESTFNEPVTHKLSAPTSRQRTSFG